MKVTTIYKPRIWTKALHESTKRWQVVVAHRRSGKTTATINHLIRDALKIPNSRYAFICPTYKQAKNVAWDIVKGVSRQVEGVTFNESELRVDFMNGSRITLYGADNPDSLRGIALWGVVFDEYSQQPSNIFSEIIRPALSDHNGYAIWIGCVVGDTRVLTKNGFKRIKTFDDNSVVKELQPLNQEVLGINKSWNVADGFFNNGVVKTKKILTKAGFELECSEIHPILTENREWQKAGEVVVGDKVCIDHSMEAWGNIDPLMGFEERYSRHANARKKEVNIPSQMDNDFAYLLGLWMAEGSIEEGIHRLTITCGDDVSWIEKYGFFKVREDQWRVNSSNMVRAFKRCGMPFVRAKQKTVTDEIFSLSREHLQHFLGGFFDGDGHSKRLTRAVGFTSSSLRLLKDIQLICSNFGAIGKISSFKTPPTKRVKKECICNQLMFFGSEYERVMNFIKPRIQRKLDKIEETERARKRNFYKERNGYFIDQIVSVEDGEAQTYDFTIPITHSFWSNGFISHNTPKGKNEFFRLYENAKGDNNWGTIILRASESGIISSEELEDARRTMSEDEYEQEFECSFLAGIKGAYYTQQISEAKKDGRITRVEHDPLIPVHTYWDVGLSDSTSILFIQRVRTEWRIIDYYENSEETLDFYIQMLQNKNYVYGTHWWPWDTRARDMATGLSLIDKAKQLGLRVEVVPNISVNEGINLARMRFRQLWIDDRLTQFLDTLSQYKKEWDDKRGEYKNKPLHDWTSHCADSLRYWAVVADRTAGRADQVKRRLDEADSFLFPKTYRKKTVKRLSW